MRHAAALGVGELRGADVHAAVELHRVGVDHLAAERRASATARSDLPDAVGPTTATTRGRLSGPGCTPRSSPTRAPGSRAGPSPRRERQRSGTLDRVAAHGVDHHAPTAGRCRAVVVTVVALGRGHAASSGAAGRPTTATPAAATAAAGARAPAPRRSSRPPRRSAGPARTSRGSSRAPATGPTTCRPCVTRAPACWNGCADRSAGFTTAPVAAFASVVGSPAQACDTDRVAVGHRAVVAVVLEAGRREPDDRRQRRPTRARARSSADRHPHPAHGASLRAERGQPQQAPGRSPRPTVRRPQRRDRRASHASPARVRRTPSTGMSATRWCGAASVTSATTTSPGRGSASPGVKWTSRLSRARPERRVVAPSLRPSPSATSTSTVRPTSALFSAQAISSGSAAAARSAPGRPPAGPGRPGRPPGSPGAASTGR